MIEGVYRIVDLKNTVFASENNLGSKQRSPRYQPLPRKSSGVRVSGPDVRTPAKRPAPPPRSEGKEPRGCSSHPSFSGPPGGGRRRRGRAGIPRQLRAEPPSPDTPPHPPAVAPPRRAAHPRSRRLPPAPECGQHRAPARRCAVLTYSAGPPWRRRGPGGAPGAAVSSEEPRWAGGEGFGGGGGGETSPSGAERSAARSPASSPPPAAAAASPGGSTAPARLPAARPAHPERRAPGRAFCYYLIFYF